jgi:hypothetical protein
MKSSAQPKEEEEGIHATALKLDSETGIAGKGIADRCMGGASTLYVLVCVEAKI